MQTRLHPDILGTREGDAADRILRSCVHCGFCTATCPTYQVLGDELDGPRGRIYLIKDMLETGEVADGVAQHLDRCLTCRACETACPSGVAYGELADIGRGFMRNRRQLSFRRRALTMLLRAIVPEPRRFGAVLRVGQLLRPLMPRSLAALVPKRQPPVEEVRAVNAKRRVLLLQGCVQRSATPNVNRALSHLLATRNIAVDTIEGEGCCGALDYHLGEHDDGKRRMCALIEAVEPRLERYEAVISTASGCGVTIKDYERIFHDDPEWKERARRVSDACIDASEFLADMPFEAASIRVACHLPCTYQHGQRLTGFPDILARAGLEVVGSAEPGQCCGSAGTYSILEPEMASELRDRKRAALSVNSPSVVATANIGCQLHLDGGETPVMHWLELLAQQVSLLEEPPQ